MSKPQPTLTNHCVRTRYPMRHHCQPKISIPASPFLPHCELRLMISDFSARFQSGPSILRRSPYVLSAESQRTPFPWTLLRKLQHRAPCWHADRSYTCLGHALSQIQCPRRPLSLRRQVPHRFSAVFRVLRHQLPCQAPLRPSNPHRNVVAFCAGSLVCSPHHRHQRASHASPAVRRPPEDRMSLRGFRQYYHRSFYE